MVVTQVWSSLWPNWYLEEGPAEAGRPIREVCPPGVTLIRQVGKRL